MKKLIAGLLLTGASVIGATPLVGAHGQTAYAVSAPSCGHGSRPWPYATPEYCYHRFKPPGTTRHAAQAS
jgi:hypothetical protein